MTFRYPFGLALYDRRQQQVDGVAAPVPSQSPDNAVVRVPQASRLQKALVPVEGTFNGPPRAFAAAPGAPAPYAPLDPPTIRTLQELIRGLLQPQRAASFPAFHPTFKVPAEIPSIAGLITQQRHRLLIQ